MRVEITRTIRAANADTLAHEVWAELDRQEAQGFASIAESFARDKFGFFATIHFVKGSIDD